MVTFVSALQWLLCRVVQRLLCRHDMLNLMSCVLSCFLYVVEHALGICYDHYYMGL